MLFNWVNSLLVGLLCHVSVTTATPFTARDGNGTAIYKDPSAPVEARVKDLLSRMTIQDKTAQLMQGDITNWMSDKDGSFNYTGLVVNMETKAGSFYVGMEFRSNDLPCD